jgi:hypothetical protein
MKNLLKQQGVAKCTEEFVLHPLPKSLGLCCIEVAKIKHYHTPLLVENIYVWWVLNIS